MMIFSVLFCAILASVAAERQVAPDYSGRHSVFRPIRDPRTREPVVSRDLHCRRPLSAFVQGDIKPAHFGSGATVPGHALQNVNCDFGGVVPSEAVVELGTSSSGDLGFRLTLNLSIPVPLDGPSHDHDGDALRTDLVERLIGGTYDVRFKHLLSHSQVTYSGDAHPPTWLRGSNSVKGYDLCCDLLEGGECIVERGSRRHHGGRGAGGDDADAVVDGDVAAHAVSGEGSDAASEKHRSITRCSLDATGVAFAATYDEAVNESVRDLILASKKERQGGEMPVGDEGAEGGAVRRVRRVGADGVEEVVEVGGGGTHEPVVVGGTFTRSLHRHLAGEWDVLVRMYDHWGDAVGEVKVRANVPTWAVEEAERRAEAKAVAIAGGDGQPAVDERGEGEM